MLATAGASLAIVVAILVPAAPANATVKSTCGTWGTGSAYGDLCIYWGQNYNNSRSGVDNNSVSNYPVGGSTDYIYVAAGTGQGQYLGNNNGSNRNYDSVCQQRLYYGPNHASPTNTLGKRGTSTDRKAGSQLGTLLNNLRSHQVVNCG